MIFEFIIIFVLLFIIQGLIYQFMYPLFLQVFILSIVFYVCYVMVTLVFYFRKKKVLKIEVQKEPLQSVVSQKAELPKEDKDIQKLKDFVSKNLKQGFKADVIKQALLKQGWPKEKVEQALK